MLFCLKKARKGKADFLAYLYKRPNAKQQTDLIDTVWAIENSESEIKRSEKIVWKSYKKLSWNPVTLMLN